MDTTSEGVSKQNTLLYAPILDHPNPVTKINDNVPNLTIHPQIYPASMEPPKKKANVDKKKRF